jgi:hypothetical protein
MMRTRNLFAALLVLGLLSAGSLSVYADSTVFDGPGFKVENKTGWFGRKSAVYKDALGNTLEKKHGWFGQESTRTKIFGSEAVTSTNPITGKSVVVNGPSGQPLVTTKRTLFGGKQTHVDGNGIFQSIKGLFN